MPAWKIGEVIRGFRVERTNEVPMLGANYWKLTHEKTGATLYYSDRDDSQMIFSVGFRTLPEDDTGVFHILEHSSLDGSESYRLKEPFVNLIKTSMAVDLNAMTFEDKTLYYFISTNERDYMNMMSVYLDAVFHPLLLSDRRIFEKEAWHLEPDGQGGLRCSGVVFNEMQGNDNQPDYAMWLQASKQLFPDMCYHFNSGGDPAFIHDLTYERFKETYERFYGVDNAIFYLSGQLGLDEELACIDRVLSDHTPPKHPRPAPVPIQSPVISPDGVTYYQLGDNEEPADNTHLMLSYILGDGSHMEDVLAFSLLSRYLAENTESPLSKAVLDAGVGHDFSMRVDQSTRQPVVYFTMGKSEPENAEPFRQAIIKTLTGMVHEGLDAGRLHDLLASHETDCRRASISVRSGFRIMESILRTHVQQGDACLPDDLSLIRWNLAEDSRYFEHLIEKYILHSDHWAMTRCIPSRTLTEERRHVMDTWLKQQADALQATPGAYDELQAHFAAFNEYLVAPDKPENEAAIPHLTPADIDAHTACTDVHQDTIKIGKQDIVSLSYITDMSGMVRASLLFDLTSLDENDLFYARCLEDALLSLPTADHDVQALTDRRVALRTNLDAFLQILARGRGADEVKPYLQLVLDTPEENLEEAVALLGEYLTQPVFDRTILRRLFSNASDIKNRMISSGHSAALRLAESSLSVAAVYDRYLNGISAYRRLCALADQFDREVDGLVAGMERVCHILFTQVKPIAHITGSDAAYKTWTRAVSRLSLAACAPTVPLFHALSPDSRVARALTIPGEVNYCAQVYALDDADCAYTPRLSVVTSYLYSKYLWDEIRAKGGAYGAMTHVFPYGILSFVSYRDPRVSDTYAAYDRLPDWLDANLPTESEIDSLIVSTLSAYFAPQSPVDKGNAALNRWLIGKTAADRQADMEAILTTGVDAFTDFAVMVRRLNGKAAGVRAALGGQEPINTSGLFDEISEL